MVSLGMVQGATQLQAVVKGPREAAEQAAGLSSGIRGHHSQWFQYVEAGLQYVLLCIALAF